MLTRNSDPVLVEGPVDVGQLLRQAVDGPDVSVGLALQGHERGPLGFRDLPGKLGPFDRRSRDPSSRHPVELSMLIRN